MNIFSLRITLFFLIMIVATSCMVGPQGLYYKPSYPDSSVTFEGGWAYGTAGPPSVIKFASEDGVIIKVRLNPEKDGTMRLWIRMDVPRGSSSQFVANDIRLTDPNSSIEWVKKAQKINLLQGSSISVPSTATINFDEIGPTTHQHVPTNVSWKGIQVWIPFSISNYHPRSVKIHLPTIVASDKEYVIPAIELVEDEEKKEQNRIEAKGKLKRLWWPYIAKESNDGSWVNINGFIVGGGITSGYIENEFGGNIMVSFTPSTKWHFSSSVIRIVDLDTDEEHNISFKNVLPQFRLTVGFMAPVLGNGSGRKISAVADIVVSEKPLELITVQLPNVLINGKEIHMKPITFRKSTGIGIIPLNW